MQGESHRKPGLPQRRIDTEQLEAWDEQNLQKLGHENPTDSSLAPQPKDADRMATIKKRSPIN